MIAVVLNNSMLNFGSFLLGFVGVLLAVVFYFRSRNFKRLSFSVRSFQLLSNELSTLPGFSASYSGRVLSNLTASKILLWNSGTDVVSQADVAAGDPLIVMLPEGVEILSARIANMSTPPNLLAVEIDGSMRNMAQVSFDYLARREGCVLALIHTGRHTDDIAVKGTVKGGGSPQPYRKGEWASIILKLPSYLIVGAVGTAVFQYMNTHEAPHSALARVGFGIVVLLVCSAAAFGAGFLEARAKRKVGGQIERAFDGVFVPKDFGST